MRENVACFDNFVYHSALFNFSRVADAYRYRNTRHSLSPPIYRDMGNWENHNFSKGYIILTTPYTHARDIWI